MKRTVADTPVIFEVAINGSTTKAMNPLAPETIEALNRILPDAWSHGNPVDLLGDAGPERYAQSLEIVANDPHTDGILVILSRFSERAFWMIASVCSIRA